MDGTTTYTPTQQLQRHDIYISRVNTTIDGAGQSREIQCTWSVNGGHFTSDIITIEGTWTNKINNEIKTCLPLLGKE